MAATEAFGTANFLVMALFLVATLAIGLFYGLRKKNARDLLMAHDMSVAPVSLSMMATVMSAILIVGTPSEIFYFGLEWSVVTLTVPIAATFSSLVFLPVFFPLKLTSVYQYLGLRYNTSVMTVVGTIGFIMQNLLYTSIALYAPSIVLSNVTGLSTWLSICLVGFVGTSYTAFGGFRAVIWADVLQATIMVGGVLSIIIQGCIVVGGFSEMLAINREHGRLTLVTWDLNPLQRYNFWNILFGQVCVWTSLLSVNQTTAQRLFSLPTYKKAAITSLIGGVLMLVMSILAVLSGLAIFATFATCDPLAAGITRRRDELVPHFVLTHLNHVPGLGGLFIACVLSGALSTISSSLNSLATVTWQDFCLPCVCTGRLSPTAQQWIIRIIGVIYGGVAVVLAFMAKNMGGVVQISTGVYGGCTGPMLAVFCLAIFAPFSNPIGVTVGMVVGLALTLFMSIGASFGGMPPATLPTSVAGCLSNVTTAIAAASEVSDHAKSPLEILYSISYMLYALFGFLITTITGIVVSLLTGGSKIDVNPDHLSPIIKYLYPKKKYRLSEVSGAPNDAFEMDQTGKTT